MKTILTICLAGVLSLTFHNISSAQNSTAPFTAPSSSTFSANSEPAKFRSFNGDIHNEKVLLYWTVENNQVANQFEVEKSTNASDFVLAAIVYGTDKKDNDKYMFYEKAKNVKTSYRVKIILKDGTAFYSPVITPVSGQ